MKKVLMLAGMVLCMSAGALWAQEKVVIGGSGGLRGEMQDLAKAYMAKHSSDSIEVLESGVSTSGGIEGTKAGRLTIGLVNRPLRNDERGGLVYRPVARGPVGVGVHKSMPVGNLSEAQICDIFSGKIKSWREVGGGDGKIVVLVRKRADEENTQIFRDKMACFRDLKISPEAVILVRGGEVLDAIDRRPGTIGVINLPTGLTTRPNIKPVAIGGVTPSIEALQSGKYKYANESGVVTLGEPKGLAKRFLEFVASPDGQKILAKGGVLAVR